MATISVELRNVSGTEAALGWAGSHTIVVDRPDGVAGGKGLGFNGAQLLGLTIGGCFCNDLRYVAADMERPIAEIAVSVAVELDGDPLVTTAATMDVAVTMEDGSDSSDIIAAARKICMAVNSVTRGFPVRIQANA